MFERGNRANCIVSIFFNYSFYTSNLQRIRWGFIKNIPWPLLKWAHCMSSGIVESSRSFSLTTFLSNRPGIMYALWTEVYESSSSTYVKVVVILVITLILLKWIIGQYIQDFILAEQCRLALENLVPLKAGDDIIHTIVGFIPTQPPLGPDEIERRTQTFFNALTVSVLFNHKSIPVMKAYSPEDYGRIKIIFTAEKSGTYTVNLKYATFLIPGCPFEITVPPDCMCAEATEVKLPFVPLLLTNGMPQTLEIFPKDRTGYPCTTEGVRLDKFDFHASVDKSCCNVLLCGKTCELIGGNWKEGLDACFTYGGSSVADNCVGSEIVVLLNLRTNRSPNSHGIFEGQICYDGHIVKCFPIVSLTCEEYERLEPTLKKPKPSDVIQLKGEILKPMNSHVCENDLHGFIERFMPGKTCGSTSEETLKEVHLNISLNFICIKEVVWTVLLSRTALFSITSTTKIEAFPETDEKLRYVVTISDESGKEIQLLMHASSTRILMALFLKFRSCITGTEVIFQEKVDTFFETLYTFCESVLSLSSRENVQLLNISRPDIVRTSHEETKRFGKGQWYNPFIVSFLREPLLDSENAWLEWAELVFDVVLENNPNGMFHCISERSKFIHPNTSRNYRRWDVQYYELTGKLVGKYLVERAMNTKTPNYRIKVRFSRSFLQQLIGCIPTAYSLERDMPELYESTLRTLTKSNFDDGVLTFCVPLYDVYGKLDQMIPLIENGEQIIVTNENADLYLNALARYHLTQKIEREIAAFRAGFTLVVPEDLLLNFDENELELLLCGWSKFDLNDLKNNHEVIGEEWHPEFPRILKWFWQSLNNMTAVDKAKFLQFSTGSSILPLGGFSQLNPRLNISMTCLYGRLPVADPSSYSICLSDHPDFETFSSALLSAVSQSACCQDKPNRLECLHEDGKINNN